MTAIVITPSLDTSWVRPLAALRTRGVGSVAITLDAAAFDRVALDDDQRLAGLPPAAPDPGVEATRAQRVRALRHALAEYELQTYAITPGRALGEVLA
jgi:hypothetical protein